MKTKNYVIFAGLLIFQLAVCVAFGHLKRGFFCDETYSYGLSNSENYDRLDYAASKKMSKTGWVQSNFFTDYVTVSPNARFSLKAPFENQKKDVHPPLYYILLHTVCFLTKGHFSKWQGISLNLVLLVALDFILLYIFYFVLGDIVKSLIALLFWSFSAAGISNILFIRMYFLLTLELFAYIAVHIRFLKKNHLNFSDFLLLFLTVVAGGLTHYYFYPFVFFFSAPVCLYFLFKDKIKQFLCYSGSLLFAFGMNLAIFPATIKHVLGSYRGKEVIKNIHGRTGIFRNFYLKWVNESIFGGTLKIFFLLFVLIALWLIVKKCVEFTAVDEKIRVQLKKPILKNSFEFTVTKPAIIAFLSFIAFAGFSFFAIVGSELKSNRYIYPVYPALSLAICALLFKTFSELKFSWRSNVIASSCIAAGLCVLSISTHKIEYQYSNYDVFAKKAKECSGFDCLIYSPKRWMDVYTALPLQFNYDETYFFKEEEISQLPAALEQRKTKNPIVLRLPEFLSKEDKKRILTEVEQTLGVTKHTLKYRFYTEVYLLE